MTVLVSASLGLAITLFAPPVLSGPDVELEDYVVVEGDSCARISKRRFGNRKRYDIIHAHNDLGPLPHDLKPGQVLRLPKKLPADPDAELTQAHRVVQARPPEEGAWSRALRGLDLFRGWRVNTLARAFAEVTFRDTTKIHLRENTLVIIYGPQASTVRRKTTTATLDKGALRSSLAALSGSAKLNVETPSATTKLDGGAALVTVDDAGASRVANHGDGKAAVRSKTKKRKRVRVAKGMGSKVEKGKEPTPPKPLPPTPVWRADTPTVFVMPAGGSGTVRGAWDKVDKAVAYRIELGNDVSGGFVSTAVTVPGNVTEFEAHNLAPGRYFAIVAAVDDDKFESIPSRMHHAQLREVQVVGAGGATVTVPPPRDDEAPPPAVGILLGSSLTAPAGHRCAFGEGPLAATPLATTLGEQTVRCVDDTGAPAPGFAVHVHGVAVAAADGQDPALTVMAGEPTVLRLQLASDAAVPTGLGVRLPPEFTISEVVASPEGTLSVTVTASPGASSPAQLALTTGDGEARTVVGTAEVTVVAPPEAKSDPTPDDPPADDPWIKRHAPTRNLIELGAFGGVFVPHPRLELFEPRMDREDFGYKRFATVSPAIGLRAGYAPLRVFAVELDGVVVPTSVDGGRATIWALRGHAIGQLGFWNTTPYVLFGAGAFGVASAPAAVGNDVDGGLHFGAGLKFFFTPRWMLRAEVRDTISPQRGIAQGVAHTVEATLGVGVTLNRGGRRGKTSRAR